MSNYFEMRGGLFISVTTYAFSIISVFIIGPLIIIDAKLNNFTIESLIHHIFGICFINGFLIFLCCKLWFNYYKILKAKISLKYKIHYQRQYSYQESGNFIQRKVSNNECIIYKIPHITTFKRLLFAFGMTIFVVSSVILIGIHMIPSNSDLWFHVPTFKENSEAMNQELTFLIFEGVYLLLFIGLYLYWFWFTIHFNDVYWIKLEYIVNTILILMALISWILLMFLYDVNVETERQILFAYMAIIPTIFFDLYYIVSIIMVHFINQHRLAQLNKKLSKPVNDNVLNQHLFKTLNSNKEYNLFMQYLASEYKTENLLFITVICQYQQFLFKNGYINTDELLLYQNIRLSNKLPIPSVLKTIKAKDEIQRGIIDYNIFKTLYISIYTSYISKFSFLQIKTEESLFNNLHEIYTHSQNDSNKLDQNDFIKQWNTLISLGTNIWNDLSISYQYYLISCNQINKIYQQIQRNKPKPNSFLNGTQNRNDINNIHDNEIKSCNDDIKIEEERPLKQNE